MGLYIFMHLNKISENRESNGDKVENHDMYLFVIKKKEDLSISLKRRMSFLFLWIEKNLYISFVKIIRADNML